MRAILFLMVMLIPLRHWAQGNTIEVQGMNMSYVIQQDSILITLKASTPGWLGIGFNDQNNIVGSDLLLFHVLDQQVEGVDLYVEGFGNPKKDTELSGMNSLRLINGFEKNGETQVTFIIALQSADPLDFQHELNKEFWLILAYSNHDEFDHHSRMRKHLKFRFESI